MGSGSQKPFSWVKRIKKTEASTGTTNERNCIQLLAIISGAVHIWWCPVSGLFLDKLAEALPPAKELRNNLPTSVEFCDDNGIYRNFSIRWPEI